MSDLLTDTGATFSSCRTWRYKLWRIWDTAKPPLVMLMLNPSTADETANDPTVERCERRAYAGGFAGLIVMNIFAICATDPDDMKAAGDPVGPENDDHIGQVLALATLAAAGGQALAWKICAGWGIHGSHLGRDRVVSALFERAGVPLYCLGVTASGQPRHPLYVGYSVPFQPWSAP